MGSSTLQSSACNHCTSRLVRIETFLRTEISFASCLVCCTRVVPDAFSPSHEIPGKMLLETLAFVLTTCGPHGSRYAHDNDAWTAPVSWQLSLCTAEATGCPGAEPAHLIAGGADCKTPPIMTFPTLENYTAGDGGADFLLSGPSGRAMISVQCDPNAASAYDLSPSTDVSAVVGNGSSPSVFVHVTMQSRCVYVCACGRACLCVAFAIGVVLGPHAPLHPLLDPNVFRLNSRC